MSSSYGSSMADLKTRLSELSEKMKVSSVEVGRKMTEQMSSVSDRMKDLFVTSTPADKVVEEATSESLVGPDWDKNLRLCDSINLEQVSSSDAARAIKKRLLSKDSHVLLLALTLLETTAKNCERMFAEIATEKILDDMVRLSTDSSASFSVREKALKLIEAWGEATEELRYFPIFEETYKSLKSRGVRFPGRDVESLAPIFTPPASAPKTTSNANRSIYAVSHDTNLSESDKRELLDISRNLVELLSTVLSSAPPEEALKDDLSGTLVSQCQEAQQRLQSVIETAADEETIIFDALSVHDEIEKVLNKYESMKGNVVEKNDGNDNQGRPVFVPAVVDDEETPISSDGNLVRNRGQRSASKEDEAAMADLDEMIFGKGGSSANKNEKKDDEEDLIVF